MCKGERGTHENNVVGNPLNPAGSAGRRSPNISRLYDVSASMTDQSGDPQQFVTQSVLQSLTGFFGGVQFFYPYGRGDLGETPWLTQTELSLMWNVAIGKGLGFSVGLTILNLFDEDTPTRKWVTRNLTEIAVTDQGFLAGFDFAEELAALGPNAVDTRFGLWDTFQLPREVRLTLKLEF